VITFPLFHFRRTGQQAAALALSIALTASIPVFAQAPAVAPATVPAAGEEPASGSILLVLPFDNRTGQPSLEWIREASAEILSRRLTSAGFAPMSRADRIYALDHLGLPQGFQPSRASSLKIAETLDANSIVVGSYLTDGSSIVAEARLVNVPGLRMNEAVTARGEMKNLISVFDELAWKLTRQLDPNFKVSEETFVATGARLSLTAVEQYTRGITEPDQQERLRHLNQAVTVSPEFSPAWMALGREEYAGQQYEQAAEAFSKVSSNDADALEAGFLRGLSLLFSGDYVHAQEAFAGVARVLPLAEVLNNQGVALARQGKDGAPLFQQAVTADASSADFHFNLGVSAKRRGDLADALAELTLCLRLRPNDNEALELQKEWGNPVKPALPKTSAATQDEKAERPDAKADPLERIERSFDAVAFHQAALMLDQVDAAHLAQLAPRERAQKLSVQAKEYLDRGLLLEAERLYQTALAANPQASQAHAGLAEIRERTGDAEAARKEAVTSLELLPSTDAYLVLARLDLAAGHFEQVKYETGEALKIDPNNKLALELKQQADAREGEKK
jgi:tetratricopeptide (TPR) repeat protein/TolB-like protein